MQINKIRNKREENTINITEIKKNPNRIPNKQFYTNKVDNLEEMGNYLETYNLPRLDQEETDNLNRLITSSEIELVIKNLPANTISGWDNFKRRILLNILKKS